MSEFIVDASVVAKWFLTESDSDRARSLIRKHHYLRAPDLLLPEVANVFWKRAQRRELTPAELETILQMLLEDHIDVTVRLLPSRIFLKQAWKIALAERRSVYDSLYLASAVQARCKLVTADDRFIRSITDPNLQSHVISLRSPALAN
jgi:predicted nucleic acid-binding protein